jgi:hypothetical protein
MRPIFKAAASQSAQLISSGDPFWSDVRFLVKLNGTHGADVNDLVDLSGYHPTFAYSSPAAVYSNVQSKFGGTSGLFDTVSNIRFAATEIGSELAGYTGEWTIEMWVWSIASSNTPIIAIGTYSSGTRCMWMCDTTANYFNIYWTSTSGNRWVVGPQVPPNGSQLFTLNAWHFVSLTKVGTSVYHHIDGELVATTTDADVFHDDATKRIVFGGVDSAFGFYGRSYIQECRITKAARYAGSNYAPPAESFPVGP